MTKTVCVWWGKDSALSTDVQ